MRLKNFLLRGFSLTTDGGSQFFLIARRIFNFLKALFAFWMALLDSCFGKQLIFIFSISVKMNGFLKSPDLSLVIFLFITPSLMPITRKITIKKVLLLGIWLFERLSRMVVLPICRVGMNQVMYTRVTIRKAKLTPDLLDPGFFVWHYQELHILKSFSRRNSEYFGKWPYRDHVWLV